MHLLVEGDLKYFDIEEDVYAYVAQQVNEIEVFMKKVGSYGTGLVRFTADSDQENVVAKNIPAPSPVQSAGPSSNDESSEPKTWWVWKDNSFIEEHDIYADPSHPDHPVNTQLPCSKPYFGIIVFGPRDDEMVVVKTRKEHKVETILNAACANLHLDSTHAKLQKAIEIESEQTNPTIVFCDCKKLDTLGESGIEKDSKLWLVIDPEVLGA
ncbi:hypothetical protein GYMLUDRAFT_55756 [Collybiopsis luxurians FD-317 M1]|nr:hypothetical protein GYMLUDRAFT_55756 [Collybiopsis luxurians FD-317 M1]